MPKAVLDTNILVSALITPRGTPAQIVQAWRAGRFDLVTSPPLLWELKETLSRPKILDRYHLSPTDIHDLLTLLAGATIFVTAPAPMPARLRDPDDLPALACALESQADYLVTGDNDLLDLGQYQGVRIVRPSAFLRLLLPSR